MIEDVTFVTPEDTLANAYALIQTRHHDCLPVMEGQHLAGIIQLTDIYQAVMESGREAAMAASVGQVMIKKVITVHPDSLIEHAATLMFQSDIPFLPVVEGGKLVGVIAESDIFKAFAEILGVNSGTVRLTLVVPDRKGQLARVAEIIRDAGVSITHVATYPSHVMQQYQLIVRVETDTVKPLAELLERHGFKVIHVDHD